MLCKIVNVVKQLLTHNWDCKGIGSRGSRGVGRFLHNLHRFLPISNGIASALRCSNQLGRCSRLVLGHFGCVFNAPVSTTQQFESDVGLYIDPSL